METKHTPGTWYTKQNTHDWYVASESGRSNDIALVRGSDEEAKHNALLIAAAKDMYETLDESTNRIQYCLNIYDLPPEVEEILNCELIAMTRAMPHFD